MSSDDRPDSVMRFERYVIMAMVSRPGLCPACEPDDPEAPVVVNGLCPPCRLVAERALYGGG